MEDEFSHPKGAILPTSMLCWRVRRWSVWKPICVCKGDHQLHLFTLAIVHYGCEWSQPKQWLVFFVHAGVPCFFCGSSAVHNCHPWFTFLKTSNLAVVCLECRQKIGQGHTVKSKLCNVHADESWAFFVLHRYYHMETKWHSVSRSS